MLIPAPSQDLLARRAAQAVSPGRLAVSSVPGASQASASLGLPQLQVPSLANASGRSVHTVEPPLGPEPDVGAAQSWLRLGYDLGLLQSRSTMQEFSVALRDTIAKCSYEAIDDAPASSQDRKPSLGRRAANSDQIAEGRRAAPPEAGRPSQAQAAGSPGSSDAAASQAIVATHRTEDEDACPGTASESSLESALQYADDSDAVRAEALQQALSFTRAKLRAAAAGTAGGAGDVSVLEMEAKWLELQEIQLSAELEKKSRLRRKLLGQLRGETSAALNVLTKAGVSRPAELKPLEQRARRLGELESAAVARTARLGLLSPEDKAKRRGRTEMKQKTGWWNALEARCRLQARDETTRVAKLRALLLKAVDALGEDEWEQCFHQGNGRLDYVAFGRATRLALAEEDALDDDSIADIFGLVDPNATGVVRVATFWAYVDVARADPLTQHDQHAARSRSRRGSRYRSRRSDGAELLDDLASLSGVGNTDARGRELALVLHHQKQQRADKIAESRAQTPDDEREEQWEQHQDTRGYSTDQQDQPIGIDELRQLVDDVNLRVSSSDLQKLRKTIESEEQGGGQLSLGGFKRWLDREHPGVAEAALLHKLETGNGAPATAAFECGGIGLMDIQQEKNETYSRWVARKQLSVAAVSGGNFSGQMHSSTSPPVQPHCSGGWDDQSVSTTALMYRLARRRLDSQAAQAEDQQNSNGKTANSHQQPQPQTLISARQRSIFAGAVGVNGLLHFYDTERFGEARPFSPEDGAETASSRSQTTVRSTAASATEPTEALAANNDRGSKSQGSSRKSSVDSEHLSVSRTDGHSSASRMGQNISTSDGDVLGDEFSPRNGHTTVSDGALSNQTQGARLLSSSDHIVVPCDDAVGQERIQEEQASKSLGGTTVLPDAEQVGHTVVALDTNADETRDHLTHAMPPAAGGVGGMIRPRGIGGTNFSVVLRRRADGFGLRLACDANSASVTVSEVLGAVVAGNRPGEFYPMAGDVVLQLQTALKGGGGSGDRRHGVLPVDGRGVEGLKVALLAVVGHPCVRWSFHRPYGTGQHAMASGSVGLRSRAWDAAHGRHGVDRPRGDRGWEDANAGVRAPSPESVGWGWQS